MGSFLSKKPNRKLLDWCISLRGPLLWQASSIFPSKSWKEQDHVRVCCCGASTWYVSLQSSTARVLVVRSNLAENAFTPFSFTRFKSGHSTICPIGICVEKRLHYYQQISSIIKIVRTYLRTKRPWFGHTKRSCKWREKFHSSHASWPLAPHHNSSCSRRGCEIAPTQGESFN